MKLNATVESVWGLALPHGKSFPETILFLINHSNSPAHGYYLVKIIKDNSEHKELLLDAIFWMAEQGFLRLYYLTLISLLPEFQFEVD